MATIQVTSEGAALCPLCSEWTGTHIDRVEMSARTGGEDGPGVLVGVSNTGVVTTQPLGSAEIPGRRHSIALVMECEICGGISRLHLTQHKGTTFVAWGEPMSGR